MPLLQNAVHRDRRRDTPEYFEEQARAGAPPMKLKCNSAQPPPSRNLPECRASEYVHHRRGLVGVPRRERGARLFPTGRPRGRGRVEGFCGLVGGLQRSTGAKGEPVWVTSLAAAACLFAYFNPPAKSRATLVFPLVRLWRRL